MSKRLLKWIPFFVILIVGGAFLDWGEPIQSQSELKNVQVLTHLTPDELREYMADVVDFLGVEKCTFCHVRDKSSDEIEHKRIAREYMKMTKELNETIFKETEAKLTCYTCHRGEKVPINHPDEEKG